MTYDFASSSACRSSSNAILNRQEAYGAELDFVHQRDGGGLLVLGVILDDSKHYAENLILKLVCLTQITENDAYPDSTTPRVVYVEQPYRSKHCYAHCGN